MTDTAATALAEQAFPSRWDGPPEPFIRSRDKRCDQLFYGVFNRGRIQAVIGPHGAGKTTLLRRLAQRVEGRRTVLWMDPATITDEHSLRSTLYRMLATEPTAATTEALRLRLEELERTGLPVLLLIDAADAIPSAGRAALEALAGSASIGGLRAVISCAATTAAEITIDSRYWKRLDLRPLSASGTERYLHSRLASIGIHGRRLDDDFDADTIAEVHTESRGWPGHIDAFARDLLSDIEHWPVTPKRRSGFAIKTAAALLLPALLLAPGGWYGGYLPDPIEAYWRHPAVAPAALPAPGTNPEPPRSEPTTGTDIATTAVAPAPEELPAPPDESEAQASASGEADPSTSAPTVADTGIEARSVSTAVEPDTAEPTNTASATHRPTDSPTPPGPTTTADQTPTESNATANDAPPPDDQVRIHKQAWILEQAPDAWTLQLMVANSLPHLQRLIESAGLPGDWSWYLIHKDGKEWYTLLYGSFPDREQTTAAVAALKPYIAKPWVRNFAGIHKSLGQRRQ